MCRIASGSMEKDGDNRRLVLPVSESCELIVNRERSTCEQISDFCDVTRTFLVNILKKDRHQKQGHTYHEFHHQHCVHRCYKYGWGPISPYFPNVQSVEYQQASNFILHITIIIIINIFFTCISFIKTFVLSSANR